jgi:hypothetical protein
VVTENGIIRCAGTIKAPGPDNDVLIGQHKIDNAHLTDCAHTLDRDDIYKLIRIQGIDFGPEFRRVRRIGTNDFLIVHGVCEWTGNFVTFLDGLLQGQDLWGTERTLKVPTMVRRVRVDPGALFAAVNKYKNNHGDHNDQRQRQLAPSDVDRNVQRFALMSADIPFRYDTKTGHLVAMGVEVEGMKLTVIPRGRADINLTHDSYEFCGNHDINAIDKYQRDILRQYVEVGANFVNYAAFYYFN